MVVTYANRSIDDTLRWFGSMDFMKFVEGLVVTLRVREKMGGTFNGKDIKEFKKLFEQTVKELNIQNLKTDDFSYMGFFTSDYTHFRWEDFYIEHCKDFICTDCLYHEDLLCEFEKAITPNTKNCLIINADYFMLMLQNLVHKYPQVNFTFVVLDELQRLVLSEIYRENSMVSVRQGFITDIKDAKESFDAVILTANTSKYVVDSSIPLEDKRNKYAYQVALEKAEEVLSPGGIVAAALPAQFQFAGDEVALLRRKIATDNHITDLALLPGAAVFASSLQTVFLCYGMKKGDSNGVLVRKYKDTVVPLEVEFEHRMPQATLLNMDVWSDVWQKDFDGWYGNTPRKKIRLGDVAEIFRGKAIKPSGNKHILVNIGDIREYKLYFDEPAFCEGDDRRLAQYALQDGDVVMPARGSYLRAAPFYGEKVGLYGRMYIASSNIIVIRPDRSKINSRFLALLLGSSEGNELIRGVQQGNKIMTLGYENLKELRLEFPELEEQNEIAANFEKAFAEYEQSINAAERKWLIARNEMRDKLWKKQGEETND